VRRAARQLINVPMPETVALVPRTSDDVRAMIDAMSPASKAQLSADWLALFEALPRTDPWVHGFVARDRTTPHTLADSIASQRVLRKCGFTHVSDEIDPEDGLVWRFEKHR
jgi:hypothetical protein